MNAKKDLEYALTLSRHCMRMLGIWPDPNVSLNDFHRSRIRFIFISSTIILYIFIPQMILVVEARGNLSKMMEYIPSANFGLMAFCKMMTTKYHGKKLRALLTSIMTDWATSTSSWERNTMLKLARNGRNLSFGYFVAALGTILFAYSVHLMIFIRNFRQPRRYLPYRFDYIQKSPNYEFTWVIQIYSATCVILSNYSIDSFIMILLLHMSSQLINLRVTLNNLIDKLNDTPISSLKFKEGLTAIIIRHEHLIRSTKTIDDCYSPVLCMHILCASLQLCTITFQVFMIISNHLEVPLIKIIFLIFYISFVLIQIYVYCHAAERLMMESTNMANGVYECKWYNLSTKNAKDLMFIVNRSVIPLKLTAGKFAVFSIELFGIAVKTSMGYLSALLTISE